MKRYAIKKKKKKNTKFMHEILNTILFLLLDGLVN